MVTESVSCLVNLTVNSMMNLGQPSPGSGAAAAHPMQQVDREKIYQWIVELASPDTRENALLELRYEHVQQI